MRFFVVWLSTLALIATPALGQPSDGAGARNTQTVNLTKVGASLRVGQPWATLKMGLLCVTKRTLEWRAADNESVTADKELAAVFQQVMVEEGYRASGASTDLFESRVEAPDLQVGALLKNLSIELCAPWAGVEDGTTDQKGSARMEVEWQVYSVGEGKVISRVSTERSYGIEKIAPEAATRLIRGAFAANARELARDPKFEQIVKRPMTSSAPQANDPKAPLAITVVAARSTPLDQAVGGVVSVITSDGHGSGVLISADGYILTNHHVAGDAGRMRIKWSDGVETVGEVIRADRRRDVALIKTPPPKARPLSIRHTPTLVGETVFAIGTPLERDLAGTLTRGVVSASRIRDGQPFIQSDVAVTHGNSGGPLLDEKGYIVGLTVSGLEPNGASANVNFFIPIDDALNVLALRPAG